MMDFDKMLRPKKRTRATEAVIEDALLEELRALEPGRGLLMVGGTDEEYVVMRAEDFEHICKLARLRMKASAHG